MNDEVAIVHENLLDIAALHEGVFVDQNGFGQEVPVYLVNAVLVGQGDDQLILEIVTVDCKSGEAEVAVPASDCNSLGLENV